MNIMIWVLLPTLFLSSLTIKYVRYSSYSLDENRVVDMISSKLGNLGWNLEFNTAMNSNMTSKLMAFKKEECSGYLYISVAGSDPSNASIFKQHLGLDRVTFVQSDYIIDDYVYLYSYLFNVYNTIKSSLLNESIVYSPLILTYNSDGREICDLVMNLTDHNEALDVERDN